MTQKNPSIEQQFISIYRGIAIKHGNGKTWSDFCHLSAYAISNAVDARFRDKREDKYMSVIRNYSKEEANHFAHLLTLTVQALEEDPNQDFLGSICQTLEVTNKHAGQFFTPYSVAMCMTQLLGSDFDVTRGYRVVNDPCCGGGCLLIAFANDMRQKGVNYQNKAFFTAQDIDPTMAMMCYIQLSLLGCAGIVIVGNILSNEKPAPEHIWLTPMYFHPLWQVRRLWDRAIAA